MPSFGFPYGKKDQELALMSLVWLHAATDVARAGTVPSLGRLQAAWLPEHDAAHCRLSAKAAVGAHAAHTAASANTLRMTDFIVDLRVVKFWYWVVTGSRADG